MNETPRPPDQSGFVPPSDPATGGSPPSAPGPPPPASASERIEVIIDSAERAAGGIISDAEEQARRYLDESRQRAAHFEQEHVTRLSVLSDSLLAQARMLKRQAEELIGTLEQTKADIDRDIRTSARPPLVTSTPPHLESPSFAPPEATPPPAPSPEIGGYVAPPVEPQPLPAEPGPVPFQPEPVIEAPKAPLPPMPPVASLRTPPELEAQQVPEAPPAAAPVPPALAPPLSPEAAPASPQPVASKPKAAVPSDGARLLATQMAVAGSSRDEIESRLRNEFGIAEAASILDTILGSEK